MKNIYEEHRSKLRLQKKGRELGKLNYSALQRATQEILAVSGLEKHVAILSFGSAGGQFLVSNSDTDYVLIYDEIVTQEELLMLQSQLYSKLKDYPWEVCFKAWERVKVNPMDVLGLSILAGNHSLFQQQVCDDESVSRIVSRDALLATVVGIEPHLRFMASPYFSTLLRTYHTSSEFPVPVCRGDVKYYLGGTRWAQAILSSAMFLEKKRFVCHVDPYFWLHKGVFNSNEMRAMEAALDFLLTAKDLCVEGSNILHGRNLQRVRDFMKLSDKEVDETYSLHTHTLENLLEKVNQFIQHEYLQHNIVTAITATDELTLQSLIRSRNLDQWKILGLRKDIPPTIRQELKKEVLQQQNVAPHTMLDEMLVTLQYATDEPLVPSHADIDEQTHQWMTDGVFPDHGERIVWTPQSARFNSADNSSVLSGPLPRRQNSCP